MAGYHNVIHRLRLAFDPLIGDYYEWNHNGQIHCFTEGTVDKILTPMFEEWYGVKTGKILKIQIIKMKLKTKCGMTF